MSENILQNEKGSVIVIAVVMLVLITIMGLSVSRLSDVDVQIAKNERNYVQEFYTADSAWREAIQWIDTRASVPPLVNKSLYVNNDPADPNPYFAGHAYNVRNFGDGDENEYNANFPAGSQDGTLGKVNYWYKIAYINEEAQYGEKGPDPDHMYFHFRITGVANGTQQVDVTVRKLFKVGQNL
ncbi:MAG: pilus assembly PilX N-terminal domain-containing protein [Desulfobacteraceae bacterium]|jgi:hypothetical protein